jgi:hypothetical protein
VVQNDERLSDIPASPDSLVPPGVAGAARLAAAASPARHRHVTGPADVDWIQHCAEMGEEIPVGQPEAGVDDPRLCCVQNECVDRQVTDPRGLPIGRR